jgi:hypothetical protein
MVLPESRETAASGGLRPVRSDKHDTTDIAVTSQQAISFPLMAFFLARPGTGKRERENERFAERIWHSRFMTHDLVPVPLEQVQALLRFPPYFFPPLHGTSFKCSTAEHRYDFYVP